jgi:hypothetical protein
MFRQKISAIFRLCYKNIKGKTDRTEEEGLSFTILLKSELIIFVPKNNEISQRRSVSVGQICK